MRDEEAPNINEEASNIGEDETILDKGFEVDIMLNEALIDDRMLMGDAFKLVYDTCKLSQLSTILLIINFQMVHGWTNGSVNDLLAFRHQLLPSNSTFPTK